MPTFLPKRNGNHHHKKANKDNFIFIMVKSANYLSEHQHPRNEAQKVAETAPELQRFS